MRGDQVDLPLGIVRLGFGEAMTNRERFLISGSRVVISFLLTQRVTDAIEAERRDSAAPQRLSGAPFVHSRATASARV